MTDEKQAPPPYFPQGTYTPQGAYPPQEGEVKPPPEGYPPQQQQQQQGVYPGQQGGYPDQQGAYPAQQGAYPAQQGAYPAQQGAYPDQQGAYLAQQGAYPSQQGAYPNQPQEAAPQMAFQYSNTNVVVQAQPVVGVVSTGVKPDNYLILSLFSIFCCCWILGIIALVFSLQVDSAWNRGDLSAAQSNSRQARGWNVAAIVGGVISSVVFGISIFASYIQ